MLRASSAENKYVVAFAVRRPQTDHCVGAEPALVNDPPQHLLRVGEQIARGFADSGIVENGRVLAVELPRREERSPVDEIDEPGNCHVGKPMRAKALRHRR